MSIDYAISTFIHKIMNLPPHQINTTNETNTATGHFELNILDEAKTKN